jgi:hypothetical protein
MSDDSYQTPEISELLQKSSQLADLENTLSQMELEFNSLQAELSTFQRRYTDLVIHRMIELDTIELSIAEYLLSTDPTNPDFCSTFNKYKEQVDEGKKLNNYQSIDEINNDFSPSDSLKSLYRNIAKKIHPDLTTDDKERERRTKKMAELNNAYQNNDSNKMQQILKDWQSDPDNVSGIDIGSQLIKIIRKIAQVQKRLSGINAEIDLLKSTELFKLMEKSMGSSKDGVDMLIQMSGYLDSQINERRNYFDFLKNAGST